MQQSRPTVAYKITYPISMDLTGTMLYFGSPSRDIAADFTPEQRRDVTIRKQIRWESLDATDAEVQAMEIQPIRKLRSNDPEVGYNKWPKLVKP